MNMTKNAASRTQTKLIASRLGGGVRKMGAGEEAGEATGVGAETGAVGE
jgi:hypothetical protein